MRALLVAAAVAISSAAGAAPSPSAEVDYADPAHWVCRPGAEAACTTGLDALEVRADGSRTLQPFRPAASPPIDCFYVYPTASEEPTDYSDLQAGPEIKAVVHDQAGRLTSRCRLFAPIYRQLTLARLKRALDADPTGANLDFKGPYQDVRAAWRAYLARDNHGRGVVLIGHSQGTILLQRLIAEEIDGRLVQKRLVSVFLAGDPSLPTPPGARVGGVFKSTPLCAASAETGCVYAWADYLDDDTASSPLFGRNPPGALVAGCVDPAAPSGGAGALKAYLHKPASAPAGDPPWVEVLDQLSVACVADAHNNVARVTVLPSRYHDLLHALFSRYGRHAGWGLHPLDVELTQGDMLDRIDAETMTWAAHSGH